MDLLVIFCLLIALAVFAPIFGYDSRDKIQSKEEQLAWLGMRWSASTRYSRNAAAVRATRVAAARRFLRRTTARGLRAIAAWLSPELVQPTV
jgi:hypothetical protein